MFVNPLEFSLILCKYDLKHDPIFMQVLQLDEGNPIKQTGKNTLIPIYLVVLANDPMLYISVWQKYVNL